jgi:AcrR family transcriptional regulator
MAQEAEAPQRSRLSRERVLRAAVELADESGIESLSMRRLASELGVVPMALYKHVADKDDLLDGMVDLVIAEIDPPIPGAGWKAAVRERILSARRALLRHPWARRALETRTSPTPVVLAYQDSMIGLFRDAGFSLDLTHHVLHAIGSRIFGFTQELYEASNTPSPEPDQIPPELAQAFPYIAEIVRLISHNPESVVGQAGCDDQFEFEFALDLLLEGIERLRKRESTRPTASDRRSVNDRARPSATSTRARRSP